MERMTAAEFRRLNRKRKPNKYRNKKTKVDGVWFDSLAEATYYRQLKWLKQAKQIKDFKIQPRYLLQEQFIKNGKTYRKIEYVADFEVIKNDGTVEVIDIKGAPLTAVFKLKRKLFEYKYDVSIRLLKYENGQFVELKE
ncbi:hypothetical protein BpPP18_14720 [Weizmannia acidilactici]|nr:hypothetical protein BpPP18_14720 [Weizmannia acidilactici]